MSSLEIRRYLDSDKDAVWELHVMGLKQTDAYGGDGPWDDDLHNIASHYFENEGEFLVGEFQGRLAAMGAFRKTGEKEAEIKRMRTHPDFQGQGFGQQIYTALEAKARELGYRRLHLDTGANLSPAQKLYLKNGFIETHRGAVDLEIPIPVIFYEKILSA